MKRFFKIFLSLAVVAGVVAGWIVWSNRTFEETFYLMDSWKVEEPMRLILLSDLHQKEFGPGNERLLERVQALKPDAILIAGDVVNKTKTDWSYAVDLCKGLVEIAPVYYGMGNHENEALYGQDLNKEFLEEKGIRYSSAGCPPTKAASGPTRDSSSISLPGRIPMCSRS